MPTIEETISAELAQRDVQDIRELRNFVPFGRYLKRRLKQKHDAAEASFKYDPVSPAQREALRQKLLAYEEILALLDTDDAACRSFLSGRSAGKQAPNVGAVNPGALGVGESLPEQPGATNDSGPRNNVASRGYS